MHLLLGDDLDRLLIEGVGHDLGTARVAQDAFDGDVVEPAAEALELGLAADGEVLGPGRGRRRSLGRGDLAVAGLPLVLGRRGGEPDAERARELGRVGEGDGEVAAALDPSGGHPQYEEEHEHAEPDLESALGRRMTRDPARGVPQRHGQRCMAGGQSVLPAGTQDVGFRLAPEDHRARRRRLAHRVDAVMGESEQLERAQRRGLEGDRALQRDGRVLVAAHGDV